MKQYKFKIILIGICIVLIVMIFSRNVGMRIEREQQATVNENDYVSRGVVAKMISLLQYTKEELKELEPTITYSDVSEDDWYYLYVNGLASMGYTSTLGGEKQFEATGYLRYGECKKLLKKMEEKEEQAILDKLSISFQSSNEKVTKKDWLSIYEYLRTKIYIDEDGKSYVTNKEIYVIDTASNNSELEKWTMVTDSGVFSCDGYDYTDYLDYTVKVYTNQKEIIYIDHVISREHTLSNVWIIENKDNDVSVFINGVVRTFHATSKIEKDLSNTIADLVVEDQQITTINLKPDIVSGKVLSATKEYIELEKYGKIELDDNYKIYKIYGEVMQEISNAVLVGYKNTDFVVSNGKVCAALVKESVTAKNIRVLIRNNGYKGLYHNRVEVTSKQPFTITSGKTSKSYKANQKVTIQTDNKLFKNSRIVIKTKGKNGKLTITSLTRSSGKPSYRGVLEIVKNKEGLTVINELSLEEYLYAVISSEMPVKYGLEALKVQAICARSYAYQHIMANSYSQYGAHVDDSTAYQVYNNHAEDALSIQAVNETCGQVLESNGQVAFAYYFSTSCGYTSDVKDVWLSSKKISYLTGSFQGVDKKETYNDLSKESDFYKFITDKTIKTFDSEYPWYRWNTTISKANMTKMVNAKLATLYAKKKSYVQTLQKDGTYKSCPVSSIGDITQFKVKKRAKSGLVKELVVVGTKKTVKVSSESFIRQLLAPIYDSTTRNDGSKISKLSLLPSGFFIIKSEKKDGKAAFKIIGGGYGHGVGMSQNGVKAMVDAGYHYEEILKHYYNGIKIGSVY